MLPDLLNRGCETRRSGTTMYNIQHIKEKPGRANNQGSHAMQVQYFYVLGKNPKTISA